jgi:hypothetical protein
VYTGHKHIHGVKTVLSLSLPNGLTAGVFGPCSVRRHDVRVLDWSLIGSILYNFQTIYLGLGLNELFSVYGDSAFGVAAHYSCIKKQHEPAQNAPLTPR